MCSSCLSYFEYSNWVFFRHPFFAAIQRVTLQFLFIYFLFLCTDKLPMKSKSSIFHLISPFTCLHCLAITPQICYLGILFPCNLSLDERRCVRQKWQISSRMVYGEKKNGFRAWLASWGKKTELQAFPIRFSYITAVLYARVQLSIIEFINKTLLMAIWAEWQWGVT